MNFMEHFLRPINLCKRTLYEKLGENNKKPKGRPKDGRGMYNTLLIRILEFGLTLEAAETIQHTAEKRQKRSVWVHR